MQIVVGYPPKYRITPSFSDVALCLTEKVQQASIALPAEYFCDFPAQVRFEYNTAFPQRNTEMENLLVCIIVQLNLVFGVAGLIWPDKLMPVYGLLMFPWPASHRAIRIHGLVAIGGWVLVLAKLFAFAR